MSARAANADPGAGLCRAWYGARINDFLCAQPDSLIGKLATNGNFTLVPEQKDAWLAQIGFLQANISGISGSLFLEFNIPRMGRRIDAVLLSRAVVFVIEFKVGEREFDRARIGPGVGLCARPEEFPRGQSRAADCADPGCDRGHASRRQ